MAFPCSSNSKKGKDEVFLVAHNNNVGVLLGQKESTCSTLWVFDDIYTWGHLKFLYSL